jgi:hypothetical protein
MKCRYVAAKYMHFMTANMLDLTTTTPWMENALAMQAMMMVPRRWRCHSGKLASLSSDATLAMEGKRCKPTLGIPPLSSRQCHGEANSPEAGHYHNRTPWGVVAA